MTARDLDQAWRIIEFCVRDPARGFREAVAEELAALLAEIRKARKGKR